MGWGRESLERCEIVNSLQGDKPKGSCQMTVGSKVDLSGKFFSASQELLPVDSQRVTNPIYSTSRLSYLVANFTSSHRPRDAVRSHRVVSSEYPFVSFAQGNRYRICEMQEGVQYKAEG